MGLRHKQLFKIFASEEQKEKDVFIKTLPPRGTTKEAHIAQLEHIHLQDCELIKELNAIIEQLKKENRETNKRFNEYLNSNATAVELEDAKRDIDSLNRYIKTIKEEVKTFYEALDNGFAYET